MSEDTKKYYLELSENFIDLTLDYNTLDRKMQEIKEIVNSRCKSDTKIKKLKVLLGDENEKRENTEA